MSNYDWNKNLTSEQRIQSVQNQLRRYLPKEKRQNPMQPYIDYSQRKKQGLIGGNQPATGVQQPAVTPTQSQPVTNTPAAQTTSVSAPTLMRNPGVGAPYVVDPAQRQAQAMTGALKTPATPAAPKPAQPAPPPSAGTVTTGVSMTQAPKPLTPMDAANPANIDALMRESDAVMAKADAVRAQGAALIGAVPRTAAASPLTEPPAAQEPSEPVTPTPEPTPQPGRKSVADSLASYESQLEAMENKYGGDIMNFDASKLSEAEAAKYMQDRRMYMLLKAGYNNAYSQLEKQEIAAQEQAQRLYTAQQLLKKYLPETLKAQGLSNLGVSQSAVLEMDNNYQNHLSAVGQNKEEADRDILDSYSNQYSNAMLENDEAKQQIDAQNRQKVFQQALADAEKYYNDEYGLFNKQAILDKYKDKLSSEELGQLSTELDEFDRTNAADRINNKFNDALKNLASGGDDIDWADYAAKMKKAGYSQDLIDIKYEMYVDYLKKKWWDDGITYTKPSNNTYTDDGFKTGTYTMTNQDGITPDEIKVDELGFQGSGKKGEQDGRVNKILEAAKNGTLKDGTVVDFNIGKGTDYKVFIDGKFYPVKKV